MCSVIEIKNANEYYIHYHSPESMVTPTDNMSDNKVLEDKNNEKSTGTNIGVKETSVETSNKIKSSKDQDVTSDRGSSASPSLEDEEEAPRKSSELVVTSEVNNKGSPTSNSKIPIRSLKKLSAPQPPKSSDGRKNSKEICFKVYRYLDLFWLTFFCFELNVLSILPMVIF